MNDNQKKITWLKFWKYSLLLPVVAQILHDFGYISWTVGWGTIWVMIIIVGYIDEKFDQNNGTAK